MELFVLVLLEMSTGFWVNGYWAKISQALLQILAELMVLESYVHAIECSNACIYMLYERYQYWNVGWWLLCT